MTDENKVSNEEQIPDPAPQQEPGVGLSVLGVNDTTMTPERAQAIMKFMQRVGNMSAAEIPAWAECMAVLNHYAEVKSTSEGEDNGHNSVS
jgi:hypothetical protein